MTSARIVASSLLIAAVIAPGAAAAGLSQSPGTAGCANAHATQQCGSARALAGATSAVVSPDGRNVYVTAQDGGDWGAVSIFKRAPQTGALTQLKGRHGCISSDGRQAGNEALSTTVCKQGMGLTNANDVTVSANGRTVYAVGSDDDAVSVYRRDPATGALKELQCFSSLEGGVGDGCTKSPVEGPTALALVNGGRQLVAAGDTVTEYDIGADGTISDTGVCEGRFDSGDLEECPKIAGLAINSLATDAAGDVLVSGSEDDYPDRTHTNNQVLQFTVGDTGALDPVACVGGPGTNCTASNALHGVTGVAMSADGGGLYTSAYTYVELNEESGYSATLASEIGAFSMDSFAQVTGAPGCLLFFQDRGTRTGCTPAPKPRGPGFPDAQAITVTPNGAFAVGAFSRFGDLVLMKRNATTQGLTPVAGTGGCLANTGKHFNKSCASARDLIGAASLAVSPDNRNVYVVGDGTIATAQIKGS